jgi:hypothetical protein
MSPVDAIALANAVIYRVVLGFVPIVASVVLPSIFHSNSIMAISILNDLLATT